MNKLRSIVALGAMALLALAHGRAHAGEEPVATVILDIQPQPLDDALSVFGAQSGLQVVFLSEIGKGLTAPRLSGTYSCRTALERLLEDTDLKFEFINARTVAIRPASAAKGKSSARSSVEGLSLAQADTQSDSMQKADNAEDKDRSSSKRETAAGTADESSSNGIQEVVVTAQRRTQSIKDVPISITALSGEELKSAGIKNATDLSFSVPGLVVQEIQPGNQMVAIRGIGSERGGSALAGIYLDEIPLSSSISGNVAGIDLRMKDLQRVEVLKGPQGTLFGEGSAGGTLRFITNAPKLDRVEGSVTGSFYNTEDGDPSYEVDGVLNLPVIDNVFGVRIVASHEDRGGWIDAVSAPGGPVIADNINDNETNEARVKALWKPTDNLTVEGLVLAHRTDGAGYNIVNLEPRRDHHLLVPGTEEPADGAGSLDNDYEVYNLSIVYDLGFAQLLSSTSQANLDSLGDFATQFFPGNQAAANFIGRTLAPGETVPVEISIHAAAGSVSSFSQELRLTSAQDGPVNWVLGAYYKDVEGRSENLGGIDIIVDEIVFLDDLAVGDRGVSTSKAWATYGDASVKLPHGWEMGGGLRYFSDERTGYNLADRAGTFGSGVSEKVTYRAYVSYRLTDTVRLYANTSTGFRSGGFNTPGQFNVGAPRTFKPETVEAYELGAKSSFWNGRVSGDVALFKNNYVDIQGDTSRTINNFPVQFTANAGEAEIKGIEASLALQLMDRWRLSLSGELLDSEFKKIDETVPGEKIPGDPADYVPDYKLVVGSEYDFDWMTGLSSRFRLNYSKQGPSHRTFRNNISANVFAYAPALEFLNASLETSWQSWTVTLFGRNLLNEDGTLYTSPTGVEPQPRPRSIGVTIAKSF